MKTLVDASVLVAVAVEADPAHEAALAWMEAEVSAGTRLFVSDHGLAELYARISAPRFSGRLLTTRQVERVIVDLLDEIEDVIGTTPGDYWKAINACVQRNLRGGIIYDAVHVRAARRERIKRIATLNVKDFRRVWDEGLVELGAEA